MPNQSPNLVTLGDIYDELPATSSPLSVWLGKDISGHAIWTDLARMPHLLIAGTTGSGKSGCINTILTSILLRATPDEVRMILIDPKRIELNFYESIPHLLTPVVSSPKRRPLRSLNVVGEMERRYEQHEPRPGAQPARDEPRAARRGEKPLPYLLVVIDELADLMMISPQDVEDAVIRLAQKSRAVGIHLVLATQRPSVDVITGMIKANVPSRVAFAVSSQTDSRVILDQAGAESLLGQGDMLFKPLGTSRLQRVQGAYVSEEEVALVVEQCRAQRDQELDETLLEAPEKPVDDDDDEDGEFDPDEDPLLEKAIEVVDAGADRVGVTPPAPTAGRLHARGPADRHARAPRDHLAVRGLETQARAGRGGRARGLSGHALGTAPKGLSLGGPKPPRPKMARVPCIAVVGSYGVGLTFGSARAPERGETVIGTLFRHDHGGKGSNQAVGGCAARRGRAVPDRGRGGLLRHRRVRALGRRGRGASSAPRSVEPTMTAAILVEASGDNRIVVVPGALSELAPLHVDGSRRRSPRPTSCSSRWRSPWRRRSMRSRSGGARACARS